MKLKRIFLGLAGPVLALAGFGAAALGTGKAPDAKVICCGQCKPGDDCLATCEVVGEVPNALTLACCGTCERGDNCLDKCAPEKRSCCEVK